MSELENVCKKEHFNKVYNDHSQAIWRFIYFKCGDQAQADDLVQESYVKLWQNCAKVSASKAKSYLYTVANNLFLNEVAHKKVVLQHANSKKKTFNNQSPEYLLEEKEFYEKLQAAIANLSETQRTPFLLNRIEGKKYSEIAEILGISVKAVEKRMSQALAILRKEIGNI